MEVVLAETAGFCMGVDLALTRLDSLLAEGGDAPVRTLGPIIHNPQVLEHYARRGVSVARGPEDIPQGAAVVIRAHGVPKAMQEALEERGARVVDATCPKVKKAQMLIARECGRGRRLLLYGEADHPEVRGLLSYAGPDAFVFDSREEFESFPLEPDARYVLAAQTTQDRAVFEALAADLAERPNLDVKVLQTICDATRQRQEDAVRIAREVDYMVVVGGRESGNTRRLAQVAAAQGTPCVHVETADELPLDDLRRCARVGVTAGASTPRELVAGVCRLLRDL
mgnify:CR=1 FL=1